MISYGKYNNNNDKDNHKRNGVGDPCCFNTRMRIRIRISLHFFTHLICFFRDQFYKPS